LFGVLFDRKYNAHQDGRCFIMFASVGILSEDGAPFLMLSFSNKSHNFIALTK